MIPADPLLAPARGRYDRRSTPEERLRAQRERLLRAVARAFVEKRPNVSRVTELARAGRASFYEFFDDFEHALSVVRGGIVEAIDRALERALSRERAPVAALRALASDFLDTLSVWPDAALVGLASSGGETSDVGRCFTRALRRWVESARSAGLVTQTGGDTRVVLATGAAEALGRRRAFQALARGSHGSADAPRLSDAQQLADALLRLLR